MKPGTAIRWTCASKRPGQRNLPLQSITFWDEEEEEDSGAAEVELGVMDSMMPFLIVTEEFLRIVPLRTSTTLALMRR